MSRASQREFTQRMCKSCGDWHYLNRWPHNCLPEKPARSEFPAPAIHSDSFGNGVNGMFHHAALRRFDSKSAFRRATREHGCEEVAGEFDALERHNAQARVADVEAPDATASAVNEALHELGIHSDSDLKDFDYGA